MTPEQRRRKFEQLMDMAHEHCDGLLFVATWVDDDGITDTHESERGNAYMVEGLRLQLYDGEAESDEDE
jgi:hypothetical protein